jgi:guanylate kinase
VLEAIITMRADLNKARGVSNRKFLLLLGPSGVGKSTIIRILRQMDARFRYISPIMTRELRPGETDKVPVTDVELNKMERQGKLLAINNLYGIRYGTPKDPIEKAFEESKFPILDWPIQQIELMLDEFPGQIFTSYITPPSFEAMEQRLSDGRDPDFIRTQAAREELQSFYKGDFDDAINIIVKNEENDADAAARKIYALYLKAIGE